MARGFLSGIIAGFVASSVGLGALSLAYDIPGAEPPVASADVSAPEPAPVPQDGAQVESSEADEGLLVTAPETRAPEPEESSGFAGLDTSSTGRPEAGDAGSALIAPETSSAAPQVSAAVDAPELPESGASAPTAPTNETAPVVETTPAAPQPEPEVAAERPVEQEAGAGPDALADAPALPKPLPDAEREEITLEVPRVEETPEAEASVEEEPLETARVSIGTPAKTLGSSQSSRLPTVSREEPETPEAREANISDLPPIERYAAPFVKNTDAPLMSIVLIDDGSSKIGVEALSTFPYPLSFAVDAAWAGAGDAMAKYRALDMEVLAMIGMPSGARAQDVEVNLPVLMKGLPEVVGLMETPDASLQANRDIAAQVAAITRDTGHGLLFFPKGLNTAQKLAAKEGVPSATVFRDFDGNGQNASAIKRFLDHATLKAEAEGGVVMVGRLRADTISALLLWGLQDRSDRVELAPVSQLMRVAE